MWAKALASSVGTPDAAPAEATQHAQHTRSTGTRRGRALVGVAGALVAAAALAACTGGAAKPAQPSQGSAASSSSAAGSGAASQPSSNSSGSAKSAATTSKAAKPAKSVESGKAGPGSKSGSAAPKAGASSSATNEPQPKNTKARPVPHKTVQPPTAGTINQTVAPVKVTTLPARQLDAPAKLGNGVTVALTKTQAINATARIPGEVAGPAVALTVRFTNTTSNPVSLSTVVVNATTAKNVPGNLMSTPPAAPLGGVLAPGASKSGVYVLTLPLSHRDPITVTVNYTPKAPTAVFVGNVK